MYWKTFLILLTVLTTVACNSKLEKPPLSKESKLQALSKKFKAQEEQEKKEAIEFAKSHKLPIRQEMPDGNVKELQKIKNGIPMYYSTESRNINDKNHSKNIEIK